MNAKEHPDYVNEKEKLAVVQKMIFEEQEVLIAKSQNFGRLSKEVITDSDVIKQLWDINSKRIQVLKTLKDKPYFGRVDFSELGKDRETYYIGKTSIHESETQKLIVLDWRAPLAGLYYSGEIGNVMYVSPDGLVIGDLELKRQYEIAEGTLINLFDKGLTPMDEFLQKALWEKKDNRLGDIVTTIQDEQNQIIRASKDGVLIIQGVAGSGKTTIVLHRIAYLMYTYQDIFRAEKMLMIVPNKLFLDYISEVLPDLGVHDIDQLTFEMLYEKIFNQSFKKKSDQKSSEINKLKKLVSLNQNHEIRQKLEYVSAFKGSMKLKTIIDHYVQKLMLQILPKEDILFLHEVLYTYDELENLFNTQYAYMPLSRRKDKLFLYIKDSIEDRLFKLEKKRLSRLDKKIEALKENLALEETHRKQQICELIDSKIELNRVIHENIKAIPKAYLAKWENLNTEKLLLNLLGDAELLIGNSHGLLSSEEVQIIVEYTNQTLKMKLESEDLPALMYIKFLVEGSELIKKYTHIIVDEAQDYNPFQVHVLRMLSANNSFTIVGDIAQGIHAYRGISGWHELMEQVFEKTSTSYKTITICYRSTKEIIDFGNAVISVLNEVKIVLAKPALRMGDKPILISCSNDEIMIREIINKIDTFKGKGYKSVAVIAKSDQLCFDLFKAMSNQTQLDIQLLTGQEDHYKCGITVLTPQLSKGLEFDAVIIWDSVKDPYENDPLHIKLLYVAITRALHELYVYQDGASSELLLKIDEQLYDQVHVAS